MRVRGTGWGMLSLKQEGKAVILSGCVDSESPAGRSSLCPHAPVCRPCPRWGREVRIVLQCPGATHFYPNLLLQARALSQRPQPDLEITPTP